MQIIFENKGQAIAWLEEGISAALIAIDNLLTATEDLQKKWDDSNLLTKVLFSVYALFSKEVSISSSMKKTLALVEYYKSGIVEAKRRIKIIQDSPEGVSISMEV